MIFYFKILNVSNINQVEELSSIVPFKQPQLVQHESSQYEYLYPENKTAFKLLFNGRYKSFYNYVNGRFLTLLFFHALNSS